MPQKKSIIQIRNLTKKFKKNNVLEDITFDVYKGEIFGIVGPNGAGKTVLLNIILGIISPDSGKIRIFGKDLNKNLKFIRERINFIFSSDNLIRDLGVVNNLKIFATLYGVKNISSKIDYLLKLLDLKGLAESKRSFECFSGGEKARLLIAKALINDPEILLLDEATVNLDEKIRSSLIELLKRLNKDKEITIIYVTHHMDELKYLGATICHLKEGKISTIKRRRTQ
jgi:ABC-2 type transport system ATP-binding protein